MMYLTMLHADEHYYLLTDDEGVLHYSESPVDAIRSIEDGYHHAQARGYEGSMSAVVNWLFFRYSVVGFQDLDAVKAVLIQPPRLMSGWNVSGRFVGFECDKTLAEPLFEKGDKPRLLPG